MQAWMPSPKTVQQEGSDDSEARLHGLLGPDPDESADSEAPGSDEEW